MNTEQKPKRLLKNFNFKYEGAHLAVTNGLNGGAASLKNEAYLMKSLDVPNESETVVADTTASGNTGVNAESRVSKSNENEETMTEQEKDLKAKLEAAEAREAALQKQLEEVNVQKAKDAVSAEFAKLITDAELVKELADAFHAEKSELVIKALQSVAAKAEEEITKSKELPADEELAKKLVKESGEGGEPVVEVEKTMAQKVKEIVENQKKGNK